MAEYVNGYPPAAYYAVDLAKAYGIELILADKHKLVQFRSTVFIKYLKTRMLTDQQKRILLVLARYSPIPLQVLFDTLKTDPSSITSSIIGLIDHSLIVPDQNGLYSIAEPISEAVEGAFREEPDVDHTVVYQSLKGLLDSRSIELPRLELHRLFFKASIRSGSTDEYSYHMTNDLIKLSEDFYHRRDYKKCIDTARVAIAEAPSSVTAWDFLIRALIQDEQWEIAEEEIIKFMKYGAQRDIDFLRGFLQRKRGNPIDALEQFLLSEKHGRTGVALKREIASCYFLMDNIAEAKRYVNEALDRKDNHYILDLAIQIANREGDESAARAGLAKLEALDTPEFVKHRLSTVELRFGDPKRALNASREAVDSNNHPTFGMLAQLTTCLIRNGDYGEAENTLGRIVKLYGSQKVDVRLGLTCRLEIERKQFSKALQTLDRMEKHNLPVYKAMRRDALAGELSISAMSDTLRVKYQEELDKLTEELKTFDPTDVWLKFIQ